MGNLITIKLFGQTYTFKTESDITRGRAVADLLVEEVARVQEREPNQNCELTKITVMILAALNLANENYDLKVNRSELLNKLIEKSTRLMQLIDTGCVEQKGFIMSAKKDEPPPFYDTTCESMEN